MIGITQYCSLAPSLDFCCKLTTTSIIHHSISLYQLISVVTWEAINLSIHYHSSFGAAAKGRYVFCCTYIQGC